MFIGTVKSIHAKERTKERKITMKVKEILEVVPKEQMVYVSGKRQSYLLKAEEYFIHNRYNKVLDKEVRRIMAGLDPTGTPVLCLYLKREGKKDN
jgi:hypothetical protein